MRFFTRHSPRRLATSFALSLGLLSPTVAQAQYGAPDLSSDALGERYHVEVSGSFWNPNLFGEISSEQFGLVGSTISFTDDLGYERKRFKDLRIVLRPSRKSKFRIQYTPIEYEQQTTLRRNIVFNGIVFPVSVPVESSFAWKVWR